MIILLWILQVLMALHTAVGAFWKFSHSAAETMPSLGSIPQGVWISLAVIEIFCAIGLVAPGIIKRYTSLIPISAIIIALEMAMFCILHIISGASDYGPLGYWGVVGVICLVIAFGRRNA